MGAMKAAARKYLKLNAIGVATISVSQRAKIGVMQKPKFLLRELTNSSVPEINMSHAKAAEDGKKFGDRIGLNETPEIFSMISLCSTSIPAQFVIW